MGYPRTHLSAATAAVANQFVTSTNMIVGDYNLANAGAMPTVGARHVTVTHTVVAVGADTLGHITVTGKDLLGNVISEDIVPLAGSIATGTKWFASVATVTGVGWVIAGGNDTIVVGCTAAAVCAEGSGTLHMIVVNTAAAGSITIADAGGTIAVIPSNQAAGSYFPYDVSFSGYLSVTQAAASDITVIHTGSVPSTYAMA